MTGSDRCGWFAKLQHLPLMCLFHNLSVSAFDVVRMHGEYWQVSIHLQSRTHHLLRKHCAPAAELTSSSASATQQEALCSHEALQKLSEQPQSTGAPQHLLCLPTCPVTISPMLSGLSSSPAAPTSSSLHARSSPPQVPADRQAMLQHGVCSSQMLAASPD